jgi:antitoxin component YwqK of YwqJK toxin-antitoxin module
MKNTILILISLLFVTGISEGKEVTYLQDRNGIKYEVNTDTPYTGKYVTDHWNGQKVLEMNYKDGKLDGVQTWWYENGQKWYEGKYKNGKQDGIYTLWKKDGQKKVEGNYKNDVLIERKDY